MCSLRCFLQYQDLNGKRPKNKILAKLKPGQLVKCDKEIVKGEDIWCKCKIGGQWGWVKRHGSEGALTVAKDAHWGDKLGQRANYG